MNNKQREDYFRDEYNWECLGTVPVKNVDHADALIRAWKLKNYNIIKIEALMTNSWMGEHYVVLGYYEGYEDCITSIYEQTQNQCITIMREQDNKK